MEGHYKRCVILICAIDLSLLLLLLLLLLPVPITVMIMAGEEQPWSHPQSHIVSHRPPKSLSQSSLYHKNNMKPQKEGPILLSF